VTCAPLSCGGPPQAAFAVGRSAGNAVTRNRVRRRLRAVARAEAAVLSPGCAYLIGADRRALDVSHCELRDTLRAIVTEFGPRSVS
jgi:ribonuclease P protein component